MDDTILTDGDQVYANTTYFKDGIRKIDYILVCNVLKTRDDMNKLTRFIENLVENGIEFEMCRGLSDQNLNYVKLHAPKDVLLQLANIHNVILQSNSRRALVEMHRWKASCFQTPLTFVHTDAKVIARSPQTLSHFLPKVITSSERSLLIKKLLVTAKYGDGEFERGIANLVKTGVITDAFSLHDSSRHWKDEGYLSDMQLLAKYWANMHCLLKNQPLNLIRKYYGPEVAFYYAFADFYTKMLIPASIIGILVFIFNIFTWDLDGAINQEICRSEDYICAQCLNPRFCGFQKLSLFCNYTKWQTLFDNGSNIMFAIFMSFWATVFLELWKRRETQLRFAWNLLNLDSDMVLRSKYEETTKFRRKSSITGEMEPYIPTNVQMANYVVTLVFFTIVLCFITAMIFVVMLTRQWLVRLIKVSGYEFLNNNLTMISMSISALLNVLVIKVCAPHYTNLAIYLTTRENPRTRVEFNNSCIVKSYCLAFANSYFPLFYLAFLKGNLFTHPGTLGADSLLLSLKTDVCHPAGCISSLTIQLLFLMLCKTWIARLITYIKPYLKRVRRMVTTSGPRPINIPRWEADERKKDCGALFMLTDYMEMAVQYGLVIFFVGALPLAPLLALLSNIFEIRMDSRTLLRDYRRPDAKRLPGIGAWNYIFRIATAIGSVVNAFIIAFTSDIIPKLHYYYHYNTYDGFVNHTLSNFAIADYKRNMSAFLIKIGSLDVCLYRSQRYGHDHPQKYQQTERYWQYTSYRMGFVVIFIQIVFILTSICAAAITDMPASVAQDMADEKAMIEELRLRHMANYKINKIRTDYKPFRL